MYLPLPLPQLDPRDEEPREEGPRDPPPLRPGAAKAPFSAASSTIDTSTKAVMSTRKSAPLCLKFMLADSIKMLPSMFLWSSNPNTEGRRTELYGAMPQFNDAVRVGESAVAGCTQFRISDLLIRVD